MAPHCHSERQLHLRADDCIFAKPVLSAPMESGQSKGNLSGRRGVNGCRAHLRALVFDQDPTDMFYLWREARLQDPDGHDLRLYKAGDNRLNPALKIKDS